MGRFTYDDLGNVVDHEPDAHRSEPQTFEEERDALRRQHIFWAKALAIVAGVAVVGEIIVSLLRYA